MTSLVEARAELMPRPAHWVQAARLSAALPLSGIVAIAFAVRALGSVGTQAPGYFPDEYNYAALGRSLGTSGDLTIRGGHVIFPALLEPLLAAPFWRLASAETAYELIQIENALFVALAAIPTYLLARELRLSQRYALFCGLFAVAVPDGLFARYVLTDPVGYLLALTSLYVAVVALARPSPRRQVAFVVFAALATAARVQYVALFLAFALAGLAFERRRVLRTYPLIAGTLVAGVAGSLALGPNRLLGYYSDAIHMHVGGAGVAKWFGVGLFLLALTSGVALVPGAVGALLRPEGRTEARFAMLAGAFSATTLLEASIVSANGSDRFEERYLIALLPLVVIAYGLQRRRTSRLPPFLVAALLLAAFSCMPVSQYATALGLSASPFLAAVWKLEGWLGTASAALVVAVIGSFAAILGVLPGRRGVGSARVALTLTAVLSVSVVATLVHTANARRVRSSSMASDPSWIDARHLGDVVAIQTPGGPPSELLGQLLWNRSVTRELLLDGAAPTDDFAAAPVTVADDGTLHSGGRLVRSPILLQEHEVSATFVGAVLAARALSFALFRPTTTPRLRLLATGRYWDGWLTWSGRITVWPDASGRTLGTLSLTLSLPHGVRPVQLKIGDRRVRVAPGERVPLRLGIDGRGPQTIGFSTRRGSVLAPFRGVSVRSTMPVFRPDPGGVATAPKGPTLSRR